jgi:hypothetical protein
MEKFVPTATQLGVVTVIDNAEQLALLHILLEVAVNS